MFLNFIKYLLLLTNHSQQHYPPAEFIPNLAALRRALSVFVLVMRVRPLPTITIHNHEHGI